MHQVTMHWFAFALSSYMPHMGSSVKASHLNEIIFALHLRKAVAVRSHLYTGKCPTSFPHTEKTFHGAMTLGISGMALARFQ